MVFAFDLPTTSHLAFQSCLSSDTYPALLHRASASRHTLQLVLERYGRLTATEKPQCLPSVDDALNDYIPYLSTIARGLRSHSEKHEQQREHKLNASGNADEEFVEFVARADVEPEWCPTLTTRNGVDRFSSFLSKHDARRLVLRGKGIEFEIAFVLMTKAFTLSLLSRKTYLDTFYAPRTPSPEQRTAAVQLASRHLLKACSIHLYLVSLLSVANLCVVVVTKKPKSTPAKLPNSPQESTRVPDLDPSTQSALASLSMAEATCMAIAKDDPYLASSIQSRNKHDVEWMIRAPELPKVRSLIYARVSTRTAEHAQDALASIGAVDWGKTGYTTSEDLIGYLHTLRSVGQAKACRFLGIDAKMSDAIGNGIAWLRAGKAVLAVQKQPLQNGAEISMPLNDEDYAKREKTRSISGLKSRWKERKEEKLEGKSTQSSSQFPHAKSLWADPLGENQRQEEITIVHTLEANWTKTNNTVCRESVSYGGHLIFGASY